jgi:Tfp pilus assembly protein PilV
MKKRSFSLVEVVVAAVIFAVASLGIFATINLMDKTATSDARLKAALFAKKILDGLSAEIEPGVNNTGGALSSGTHQVADDADFSGYTASYYVSADTATGARKVKVTVTWEGASFGDTGHTGI